ncbi:MAG TPA: hypothetical protein DD379_27515 [Cyanobacteria bacterium UBA11162]|nr:hypothetical protein [Cyanobacteria bacterium UBA11162]
MHSRYADGTPVLKHQRPPRFGEPKPDPNAVGAHSRLRWDTHNKRIYQAREFDVNGQPVRDIDFTSPTYPNGTSRADHFPPPHQHRWLLNPTGGTPIRNKIPEPL